MSGKQVEWKTLAAAFEDYVRAVSAVDSTAIDETRVRLNAKLIDESLQKKQVADAQEAAEAEAAENARAEEERKTAAEDAELRKQAGRPSPG